MITDLRPCNQCDRIKLLFDGSVKLDNGYCHFNNSIEPLYDYWYCPNFLAQGVRLDPKLVFTNARRRRHGKHREDN